MNFPLMIAPCPSVAPVAAARRILCVDDDPLLVELLAAVFTRAGHLADVAADGVAARACVARAPYDLIITDHQMPHLNGLGLVQWLRDTDYAGLIVVHSAALTPTERIHYQFLRVDAVVGKGMGPDGWLALLDRLR